MENISNKKIEDTAKKIIDQNPMVTINKDLEFWKRYYSNFDNRFDYLTKMGQFSLPMIERKIPLQKRYIDFLISKKSRRPFKYNVYLDSKEIRKSKFNKDIKNFVEYALLRSKGIVYETNMKLRSIERKISELQGYIKKEEQIAQQQGQQPNQAIYIQLEEAINQLNFIKDQIGEDISLGQEVIDDYKIQNKMSPSAILERIMTKYLKYLEKVIKFNILSTNAFKSKVITGKSAFMVARFNNEIKIKDIKHSSITYPKDGTEKSINKKDWVYYTENMTLAQIEEYWGEELRNKYPKSEIEKLLITDYINQSDNRPIYALPDGGAVFGNGELSNYVTDSSLSRKVQWIWFRGSIPVIRKTNIDKKGRKHSHIITNKKVINKKDYRYNKGYYINKNNSSEKYKKEEVYTYNEENGDKIEKRKFNKLYYTILIDNKYFVNTREWKHVIRDKEAYNRFNLPIFGHSFDDETDQPYSLIEATNDIQDLIDIVHVSREYMIAVAGTKSSIIDLSQKPDNMSIDEWEMNMKLGRYYIQTTDDQGRPKNTSFNQFQSWDNSLSAGVQYYDRILASLENLMGQILGISYQALGETVATDQVKTSQMAIQQTSLITEMLFYEHALLEVEVLEEYLNISIKNLDKEDFIFSDIDEKGTTEYILKTDKIGDENIKVHLYNSGEDYQKVEELRRIALQMHNELKLRFSDILNVFGSETVKEMEAKVKYFEEKQMKLLAEQNAGAAQSEIAKEKEIAKFKMEMEMALKEKENQFKAAELKLKQANAALLVKKEEFEERAKTIDLKIKSDANKINLIKVKEDTAVEKSMLRIDDKHQSVDEQIRLLGVQLNAINNHEANKIRTMQAHNPMKSSKTINDN